MMYTADTPIIAYFVLIYIVSYKRSFIFIYDRENYFILHRSDVEDLYLMLDDHGC